MTTDAKPNRSAIAAVSCVVAALLAVLAIAPARAQPAPPAKDADHAKRIIDIMEGRRFRLAETWLDNAQQTAFCHRLGDDLRTQAGITHVEPVARAKYYDDPVFRPFRDRCPGLELNGVIWPTDRYNAEEARRWERISEEQRDWEARAYLIKYFGTRNFKMYRLDLDDDPANGDEHVFYSERFYRLADQVGPAFHYERIPKSIDWNDLLAPRYADNVKKVSNGGFTVIDLGQCKRGAHRTADDPYNGGSEKTRDAFAGIFRYRDRHMIYDISVTLLQADTLFHGYSIDVDWYKNGNLAGGCNYYEIPGSDGPARSAK